MTRKTFILCIASLLCTATVKSQDVYVYTTGNYTPVTTVKQVSTIIFGNSGLTLKTADGSTSDIPYELFSYFRFYETPTPLSIKKVTLNEAGINYDGNLIAVKLQGNIDRIEIVSVTGSVLKSYCPHTDSFRFTVTDIPTGVYLVKVVCGENNYIKKIVKK